MVGGVGRRVPRSRWGGEEGAAWRGECEGPPVGVGGATALCWVMMPGGNCKPDDAVIFPRISPVGVQEGTQAGKLWCSLDAWTSVSRPVVLPWSQSVDFTLEDDGATLKHEGTTLYHDGTNLVYDVQTTEI